MNISLLLNWWWKYQDNSYEGLWKTVIQYKSGQMSNQLTLSPFWKEIMKLENVGKISVS